MYTLNECYKILELQVGASKQDIKKAYIRLAKTWHPDRFPDDIPKQKQAEEKFKAINEAYSKLKDLSDRPSPANGYRSSQASTWTGASSHPDIEDNPNISLPKKEYFRAIDLVNSGRILAAIRALDSAIGLDPEFLAAYQLRGHLFDKLGRKWEAARDFFKAKNLQQKQRHSQQHQQYQGQQYQGQQYQGQQYHQQQQQQQQQYQQHQQKQRSSDREQDPDSQHNSQTHTASSWTEILSVKGHRKAITSITSGPVITTSSFEGEIKFWQFGQGKSLHTIQARIGSIYQAIATGDGRQIITVGSTNLIRFWDLAQAKPVRTFGNEFGGHVGEIYAVAISPDRKILISAGSEKVIKGWELKMGRVHFEIRSCAQVVSTIAMSPAGDFFACCTQPDKIHLFYVKDGQWHRSFRVGAPITSLKFIDGETIVSGDTNGTIQVRSLKVAEPEAIVHTLADHHHPVTDLAYNSSHNLLVSSSLDQTIKLWNIKTGKLITSLEHSDEVLAVNIHPSKQQITSGTRDGGIHFWEYSTR